MDCGGLKKSCAIIRNSDFQKLESLECYCWLVSYASRVNGVSCCVWQGHWLRSPNGNTSVAIKILQEGTSPLQNRELLEEARVMASVNHPCCVRIQAVCMTAHMMLISELLPTGSLLDYVREHQYELNSATLLLWAKQIAEVGGHYSSQASRHTCT